MNFFERLGRLLVANLAAFLTALGVLLGIAMLAPSVPTVGPLLLEHSRPVAFVASVLAWVRVMAP